MKNMQHNIVIYNRIGEIFRVLQEIVAEEHDGDVILYTGLGYGADSKFHRMYC